jgi:hypothetical protein
MGVLTMITLPGVPFASGPSGEKATPVLTHN